MRDDLDSLIRRVDEDRWLASRFAPPDARRRLIALYAVNYEIARTAEAVSEPSLGDIRLEWWRSRLEAGASGAAQRDQPALAELARVFPAAGVALQRIAAARRSDLDPAPFETWADLERYIDLTAGELMRCAVRACDPAVGEEALLCVHAPAQAWGYAGLLRVEGFWRARGRDIFPREGGGREEMRARAEAACADARKTGPLPAVMFPAVGYAALTAGYLRAQRRGAPEPPLFLRQLRLVAAAATGRS